MQILKVKAIDPKTNKVLRELEYPIFKHEKTITIIYLAGTPYFNYMTSNNFIEVSMGDGCCTLQVNEKENGELIISDNCSYNVTIELETNFTLKLVKTNQRGSCSL